MEFLTIFLLLIAFLVVVFIFLRPTSREGASFITGSRAGGWGSYPTDLYGVGDEKKKILEKQSDHLHSIMRKSHNYEEINPAMLTDFLDVVDIM